MWLVTWLGVYFVALTMFTLLAPRLAAWPLPLRTLAFTGVFTTVMTWLVMPALTWVFRPWLYSRQR
jgi:hypothetical protein